jgi:glycine dehydrogenase subunit 1
VNFTPHTDDEVREMLATIGAGGVDDLFEAIPQDLRLVEPLDLPAGMAEHEVVDELGRLGARNRDLDDLVCFAGRGAYDHYIPSVVWALASRSEFSTAYTPYQPELSQGVLQALFEFQSMICALTGLEVSNASLYDGATALVEAMRMSIGADRRRIVLAGGVDPRLAVTLRTYGAGPGVPVEQLPAPEGAGGVPASLGADVAAVVVQHPNVYGVLEDVRAWAEVAHAAGARLIQVFDPTSLGVLAPPGELGVDIAVAEGQALGNHLAFGGPYLGIVAARMADVRRMPGRIVGETVDAAGRTGYVLTLQAREQHIRREKATSNVDGDRRDDPPRVVGAGRSPRAGGAVRRESGLRAGHVDEGARRRAGVPRRARLQGVHPAAAAAGSGRSRCVARPRRAGRRARDVARRRRADRRRD